jgi:hypothetical protein
MEAQKMEKFKVKQVKRKNFPFAADTKTKRNEKMKTKMIFPVYLFFIVSNFYRVAVRRKMKEKQTRGARRNFVEREK